MYSVNPYRCYLLNPEPGLLSLGFLHDLRACVAGIGGDGLHVDMLAIDVPRWLVSVRHDNEVVPATERVLDKPKLVGLLRCYPISCLQIQDLRNSDQDKGTAEDDTSGRDK